MKVLNPKRAQVVKSILSQTSGTLEVRCFFDKSGHSRIVTPKKDKATRWYRGVDKLSDEEKRTTIKPYVDPEDSTNHLASVKLEHGKTFDLGVEEDRLVLKWLFECDRTLAMTREEGLNDPKVTFYVHNEIVEIAKREQYFRIKDMAIEQLRDLSDEALTKIMRLMNYDLINKSKSEMRLLMREELDSPKYGAKVAEQLLNHLNDRNLNVKDFIVRAQVARLIIRRDIGSRTEFYYGDPAKVNNAVFLGNSTESVIAFLTSEETRNQGVLLDIETEMGEPIPGRTLSKPKGTSYVESPFEKAETTKTTPKVEPEMPTNVANEEPTEEVKSYRRTKK